MSSNLYELIALGARYAFAALMLLIVIRAWRITIVDSRRAATLRRMSPETGIVGELLVTEGDQKARRGMRYPVIREGMIGASRRADIRIRHGSVRRRHAYFQMTPKGLSLRSHAGAPLADGRGRPVRELLLRDGDALSVGGVRLLLVLTEAPEPAHRARHGHKTRRDTPGAPGDDGLFDADPDRMFREQPVLRHVVEPPPEDRNELFNLNDDNW